MADHSGWAAQEKAILQGKAANILINVPTRETYKDVKVHIWMVWWYAT
jgi:hypothetical protein